MAKLMGILNVTPNSCYDGGKYFSYESAVARGIEIAQEGADILDIGGESTWIESLPVSVEDELERVIPVIKALSSQLSIPISIDTMKPKIAYEAVKAGVSFINDISGFKDPEMVAIAKESNVKICVMHMQGTPQTMQENPFYPEGVVDHIRNWFKEKVAHLTDSGIDPSNIILDPGIGFGKTVADNLEILGSLRSLKALGFSVLLGTSRKSFLSKICNKPRSELLAATLASNIAAILAGADIIRVHDIKEHKDALLFLDSLYPRLRPNPLASATAGNRFLEENAAMATQLFSRPIFSD